MFFWKFVSGCTTYYIRSLPNVVFDNKTKKTYTEFYRVFLKDDLEKKLSKYFIENNTDRFSIINDEKRYKVEKVSKGFFSLPKTRIVYSFDNYKEPLQPPDSYVYQGAFIILGTEPAIYTRQIGDIIRDRETGVEYKKGKWVINETTKDKNRLILAENLNKYDFIVEDDNLSSVGMSSNDYLREIWANNIFKK